MKKILVLCTGNSCRSQIAEGYLPESELLAQFRNVGQMIKDCSQKFIADNLE